MAGYRVATTDLRGHGESNTAFTRYGDDATAEDIVALVRALGTPAVIVGSSMATGAAVIAAAEHPELVRGLVLIPASTRSPSAPPKTGDDEDLGVSTSATRVVFAALASYGLSGDDAVDATRFLRSALHGFVALETGNAFELPVSRDRSFSRLVDSVVTALSTWSSR